MFTVSASFIGKFKVGDNINHSLNALSLLYHGQAEAGGAHGKCLAKPIIFLLASVAEGILFDLHYRLVNFTKEGVRGIAADVAEYIRERQIDDFSKYINSAKKHKLLGEENDDLFEKLENLRKLRNRIHIQNEKNHFEPDDARAFSLVRQRDAEQVVERLAKFCAANFIRNGPAGGCVEDFQFPWSEHFP